MTTIDLVLLHGPAIPRESTIHGLPALREPAVLALPDLVDPDRGHLLASMYAIADAVDDGESRELQLLVSSPAHVREIACIAIEQRDALKEWEADCTSLAADLARTRTALRDAVAETEIQRGIASVARALALNEGTERLRLATMHSQASRENAEISHRAAELERASEIHDVARTGLLVQFGDLCMDLAAQDREIRRLQQEIASRDVLVARFDRAARAITGKSAADLAQELEVPMADPDDFMDDTCRSPIAPGLHRALRRLPRLIEAHAVEVRQ